MKRFLALALVILSFVSCNKTNLLYQINSMMDLKEGAFHSDFGGIYYINGGTKINDGRYMVSLAVTDELGGNEFRADILEYYKVSDKELVLKSAITDDSQYGYDAAQLSAVWVSGGRINLASGISFLYTSTTDHLMNLVYDDTKERKDTLFFTLRHNAFGESMENPDCKKSELAVGTAYVSCPIGTILPKDKKSVILAIDWEWYKDDGYKLIPEHETHRSCFKYVID